MTLFTLLVVFVAPILCVFVYVSLTIGDLSIRNYDGSLLVICVCYHCACHCIKAGAYNMVQRIIAKQNNSLYLHSWFGGSHAVARYRNAVVINGFGSVCLFKRCQA